MSETVIVDYGMANLRSVQKAFARVGHAAVITDDPNRIAAAAKVVLPGVGAFQDAIARVREAKFAEPILDHIRAGRPFLGICLGLQMLFTRSFEDGEFAGLDLFAGDVVRFGDVLGLKVPHMGWNQLRHRRPDCPLLRGVPEGAHVYFVHSYFARPEDESLITSVAEYPDPFAAVIWRDNVYATQFHPEKSQQVGQTMLRNFAGL
ncbi:MAG TPA: imidazole glycerol phosphate synthase subunit HisH [Urbifossiella sp.]|jgi:glutamine amidotransferase